MPSRSASARSAARRSTGRRRCSGDARIGATRPCRSYSRTAAARLTARSQCESPERGVSICVGAGFGADAAKFAHQLWVVGQFDAAGGDQCPERPERIGARGCRPGADYDLEAVFAGTRFPSFRSGVDRRSVGGRRSARRSRRRRRRQLRCDSFPARGFAEYDVAWVAANARCIRRRAGRCRRRGGRRRQPPPGASRWSRSR